MQIRAACRTGNCNAVAGGPAIRPSGNRGLGSGRIGNFDAAVPASHPMAQRIPRVSVRARGIAASIALAVLLPRAGGQTTTPGFGGNNAPPMFVQVCSLCHGGDARGTDRGTSLVNNPLLRGRTEAEIADIIRKGKDKMPAFPLPPADVQQLARYVRQLNLTGSENGGVPGDRAAGERVFFGDAQCATCHTVGGRGRANGPDLSDVGARLTYSELTQSLTDPSALITPGYEAFQVTLNAGTALHGFARARGSHDVVLQTDDGRLHLLLDREYRALTPDAQSAMPGFHGPDGEQRDLLAYLSELRGRSTGPLAQPQTAATPEQIDAIAHPKPGDWPTYNGRLDGNRHSTLDQVNRANVARLQLQWTFPIPFSPLETTPLVVDGVMYVTGNNQVYALSGRTGREIWRYQRPKSLGAKISADARIGVNRGVAFLGDRVFYLTDNAHLLALDRLTGVLLWEVPVFAAQDQGAYGGTSAPLVVGDLVITGVSGGDDGIRGFVAAFKATTGEQVWKLWTIPQPGEPTAETWQGKALLLGGGATWLSGSADPEAGIVYWAVGNPHPDTDGDDRLGANLYSNSDLAIDLKTGRLLWYYQFTPHDLHDWDANQPIVLVNDRWKGEPRQLLLHANRNGFLYVLDRKAGKPLLATRMVDKLSWASGIDEKDWTPRLLPANETDRQGVKTAPAVRGATNWYSTAYNPATRLYYVMTVEDYSIYRKAEEGGFGRYVNLADPAKKILRAFDIETGKVAWQIDLPGQAERNYSGVLSTAGGLVFFGETSGGFAAVDAKTGEYLWHFETNSPTKASPMAYAIAGRQYIATAFGGNILSFALPDHP
jgi:PQQ-dependent dehydrogenase (methanol/ethanol family)